MGSSRLRWCEVFLGSRPWSRRHLEGFEGSAREPVRAPLVHNFGRTLVPWQAVLPRPAGQPGKFPGHLLDIERVESGAGGPLRFGNQRLRTASPPRHEQRQASCGGLVDDQAPGFGDAGKDESRRVSIQPRKFIGLQETRSSGCLRRGRSGRSHRESGLPADHHRRGRDPTAAPASIGCGSRRRPRSGATGSSRGRSGKPRGRKGIRGVLSVLRDGCARGRPGLVEEVIDRVVTQGDAVLGHAELGQVVAMAKGRQQGPRRRGGLGGS